MRGSFWDESVSGLIWSDGGEGVASEQMQSVQTFGDEGWDFGEPNEPGIWRMCVDGVDYPRLAWEFGADFVCPDGVMLEDAVYLCERWMGDEAAGVGPADLTGDGFVGLEDFARLSEAWLREGIDNH